MNNKVTPLTLIYIETPCSVVSFMFQFYAGFLLLSISCLSFELLFILFNLDSQTWMMISLQAGVLKCPFFLFWSLKRSENSVFVINQLPSCAWSFRLLYMLFLPVFCNNLIHNQIGLQCKVYNGKLDLCVVVNMCKSVANIAKPNFFQFSNIQMQG